MHAELLIQPGLLYGFLAALARVTGVIVFVPIPGFSAGPDASRIVLALALTVALAPAWPSAGIETAPGAPLAAWRLAGQVGAETALGLTMGLVIALLLEGLQLTAQVLGLQAGYSYASTVDPNTQADSTIFQVMAQLLAGMLFFAFGFDREVLRALARSFESTPAWFMPGGPASNQHALEAVVRLGAAVFSTGLQLAMPVVALLVLLDIAFAVLGRLRAQLQLLSLSFSIKMLTALIFFAAALAVYPAMFERTGALALQVLYRILNF